MEYVEYAATIEHKTVEGFLRRLRGKFYRLHPSLKRLCTLQSYVDRQVLNTVECYDAQNGLPESTTYGKSERTLNRAFGNMIDNRLGVGPATHDTAPLYFS